ncbi:MAG: radical SAM protein [Bacteroidota bacterium]
MGDIQNQSSRARIAMKVSASIQRIGLIQPIVQVGKSLRIQKSPTGIQCISAYLKRNGLETRMFHAEESPELLEDILDYSPDLVGFSAFTVNFPAAQSIAQKLRNRLKETPFVLGGWHASGVAESYLRGYEEWSLREVLSPESPFDFIVIGEGEEPIVRLIGSLNEGKNKGAVELSSVQGIGYLDENNHVVLNRGTRVAKLDDLPDPDWDGLDINTYRDQRNTSRIDLSVHAQRGCRFRCTFCQTPSLYESSVKRMSPERVVNYVESLITRFNPTDLTFTDEDFLSSPQWVKELCLLIIERGLNKVCYGSFGSLNDIIRFEKLGVLELLAKAGWQNYFVGIESLNSHTLNVYDRPISQKEKDVIQEYLKKIQAAIEVSRERNLLLFGDYIIGYFEESETDLEVGCKLLKSLRNMLYVYLPIFTPFPGTPVWQIAVKKDLLGKTDGKVDWSQYDCSHQVTNLPFDAMELRDAFEREYFTSENYVNDMLEHIGKSPEFLKNWYLPLFNKLKRDHNGTSVFDHVIDRLCALGEPVSVQRPESDLVSHF